MDEFIDDLDSITIDDEMLELLGITKKELDDILIKSYVKNIDYVDLQTQSEEEIKSFNKRCKLEKRKKEMFAFVKKTEDHANNLSKKEEKELYSILSI